MTLLQCVDGVSIHYVVLGEGIPIIFIHPPLLTSEIFHYQVSQLSQQFKTITFDIRGHGQSSTSAQPIVYSLVVQDIFALMDHLKIEKTYLCGYSTGGSVILEALQTKPDRFYGSILLSAMSEVSDFTLRSRIKLAIYFCKKITIKLLMYSIIRGNSNNKQTYKRLWASTEKGNVQNWKQYYQASLNYNCTHQISTIQIPTLLIYGEKDTNFHRYAKIIHERLPNNQLHWVKEAKHQIPTKSAAEMNMLVAQWVESQNLSNK